MIRRILRYLVVALTITLFSLFGTNFSAAQVTTGDQPLGSFGGGPFDSINLGDLNVHFDVPIVQKKGRGTDFVYDLGYDNSIWYISSGTWQPVYNYGWHVLTEPLTGYVAQHSVARFCTDRRTGLIENYSVTYYGPYYDVHGTKHPMTLSRFNLDGVTCAADGSQTYSPITDNSEFVSATLSSDNEITIAKTDGTSIVVGGSASDRNGNVISTDGFHFTDTLGTTALSISGTEPGDVTYTYNGPQGQKSVTVTYTNETLRTNFGCSGVSEFGPFTTSLVTSITLADGSQYLFTYEQTPGYSGDVTGRIATVKLPTGGTISYSYPSGGTSCTDGSTTAMTRTTPDGVWQYSRTEGSGLSYTTVTGPAFGTAHDTMTLTFKNGASTGNYYETSRIVTDHDSSLGQLETVTTCYNNDCNASTIAEPIAQKTVTIQLPNGSGATSKTDTFFDSHGQPTEIDEYDFGSNDSPGPLLRKTLITYATLGNGIYDQPASVIVKDGAGNTVAETDYAYDQTSVIATSGTPQHVAISGARGNPTTITRMTQSGSVLTQQYTYFDTGNVQSTTDVNGTVTEYTDDACGNSFPTAVSVPTLSQSRSISWDCNGGVVTSISDENGHTTTYSYNDSDFYRVTSVTDPLGNVTNYSYTKYSDKNPAQVESVLNFGSATQDVLTTLDGLGRTILSQTREAPSSLTFDSIETSYDSLGRVAKTTLPYAAQGGSIDSGAKGTTTTYDALNRPLTVTDGGGGTISYSYSKNDVLVTVGGGETRQLEYDGLGRLTSVCELTSGTGSGTCGQTTTQQGYWTTYTYDALGNLIGVTQNAQSSGSTQTRSFTYDAISRLTDETNPESGHTHYVYDSVSDSTHGCVWTNSGDLVEKEDAAGNFICYKHDGLHRLTDIYYYGTYASKTPEKHFVYDSATVNSVAMAYAVGRLAEAYTGPSNNKITDEGFSYSKRGEITDVYEKTPNSGGYYRADETYWANGLVDTLGLYNPSASAVIPTITYAPDGEGRVATVSAASGQNPVLGTTYNPASLPTAVVIGSDPGGSDKDTYTYDANTNRLTNYSFTVNNTSQSVTLGWNANGSLASQAVVDGFNSANSQSCTYTHDDLGRISKVDCGSGWTQNFTIDSFGNAAKSGSLSFSALYGTSTNRITNYSSSYDSDGNLTGINLGTSHTYSWDAEGRPVAMDSLSITYDAFGRMVEQNNGGAYKQIVYGSGGTKLALMNGGTLNEAFVVLPAGSQAVYTSSGLDHYRHSDWLGTSRLSTTNLRGLYSDAAYAPYGEYYAAAGNTDVSYTGQNQDTVSGNADGAQYDFMYRQYSPVQGRWLSPDPLGLGAVDPANPQTWNRYAYVGNSPMNRIDPLGFCGWELWGYYWVDPKTGKEELVGTYLVQGAPCDGGGGGAGRNGTSVKTGCVNPTTEQRVVISAMGVAAKFWNKTIGIGLGISAGAGYVIGTSATLSRQLVVSPDGKAAFVTTVSNVEAYPFNSVVSPGAGGYGGFQYSFSDAKTPQDLAGTSIDYGFGGGLGLGAGGDLSFGTGTQGQIVGQVTVTLGGGAGEFSHGLSPTNTYVTPICSH